MAEWYRHHRWDPEIEEEFERRLSRSKDPEQILKIQGYELLEHEPSMAAKLLRRCADLNGEWAAAACLYLAQAHVRMDDLRSALVALDRALAEQQAAGRVQTGARTDWLLVVALLKARDRYSEALACLLELREAGDEALIEERAAEALIRVDLGEAEAARALARGAMDELKALVSEESAHSALLENLLERLGAIESA